MEITPYHCPIRVLQDRFAIEANIDARHKIAENEHDDTRVVDPAPKVRRMRRAIHQRMVQSREPETKRRGAQMECDYRVVPRGRLGIVPRKCVVYEALAHHCKDTRKQMAEYIGRLVVEVRPALEASLGVVRDGAISMADAIIILIPLRDLVIRQEAVMVFIFRLFFNW